MSPWTDGSNPLPSSGESAANLTSAGQASRRANYLHLVYPTKSLALLVVWSFPIVQEASKARDDDGVQQFRDAVTNILLRHRITNFPRG